MLARAARLALRSHGRAEPNPLVGCVVVAASGEIVGAGYHPRFGGPHAEVVALRQAGERARGATVYVTLEPCAHVGRTPPCTDALIRAHVARVVYARRDPTPDAAGGGAILRQAGISAELNESCRAAVEVSEPFIHRARTGLPYVIAKWAQTLDGRIATRAGTSRWISSASSRRLVHRERGRVDAILTGIGTVKTDDPLLTARNVRVRRSARRVIIDPDLETPLVSKLVDTARAAPITILHAPPRDEAALARADALRLAGAMLIEVERDGRWLHLPTALRRLVAAHDITTIMVESGGGLLGALFRANLVNEALVFIAPMLFGDQEAIPALRGFTTEHVTDGVHLHWRETRLRGGDIVARYRVSAGNP